MKTKRKTITKKPGKNVCTRGKSPSDLDGCSCTGSKRISAIRNVRNYTFHFHVDDYLNVIRDAGNPQEVRVVMAEALGWFTNSVQRPHILEEIKKMQQTANLPEDLKAELEQTIKRLSL